MLVVFVVLLAAVQALIFAGASLWLVIAVLRARGNAPQTAAWPLKNPFFRLRLADRNPGPMGRILPPESY
jgi:hypothetical protein